MLNSPIEEIKNRLDIVEVIGSYIKLQKAGANFRAVCPFHSEKKPSFFVNPARQIWHCFGGCSEGGDIFKFVMKIEGVEFGDALRILAQKAGVQLKRQDPKIRSERQKLYEICELSSRFFEKQLQESKTGEEAKKYLLLRGIKEENLRKWRVGYAPDVWQGLSDFLSSRGYKNKEIEKAGLALTSEKGSFYDRFRGRIIFPIFDLNSQVVGFGGRVFKEKDGENIAKYVNTPNTLLYDKSRILYGLDKAKVEIRRKDFCILVEGYIDVILVSQAGFENVVATSGTALTSFQLQILKRYSDDLFTAFDMDIAGDSATKRGIDLAQGQGFNIKVITMPEDRDPADIISQNPEDWQELIKDTKSIIQFYFETTFTRFSAPNGRDFAAGGDSRTPEGKREISKILLPVIKRIPNKIEQSHWIQELAKKLNVKEEIIREELKKIKTETQNYDFPCLPALPENVAKSRKEIIEEKITSLVLKNPQNLSLIDENYFVYFSPRIRMILSGETSQETDFLNYLYLKAEVEEESDPETEIQVCLREIKLLDVKNNLDGIAQEIKEAEQEKNYEKINELIKEFNKLATQLWQR